MLKNILRFSVLASILIALPLLGACGGNKIEETPNGTIQIGVTDQPGENITSIIVTTNLIEASTATTENESGWQTLLDGEASFDLIAVAGIEDILGQAEVPDGTYNQVRLHVTSVMVTLNGEEKEATVPSGIIRLVRPITVQAGETTAVTFDFDAPASVVVNGNGDVLFKPVVKLLVRKGDEPFQPTQSQKPESLPEEKKPETPSGPENKPADETPKAELPPMTHGDPDGFFLNITSPAQSEVVVDSQKLVISGETSVDAAVSVGDEFVDVDVDGKFEATVQLEDGINIIEVVASIPSGEQFNQIITVIYSP